MKDFSKLYTDGVKDTEMGQESNILKVKRGVQKGGRVQRPRKTRPETSLWALKESAHHPVGGSAPRVREVGNKGARRWEAKWQ